MSVMNTESIVLSGFVLWGRFVSWANYNSIKRYVGYFAFYPRRFPVEHQVERDVKLGFARTIERFQSSGTCLLQIPEFVLCQAHA
jgi:hypothetical protein